MSIAIEESITTKTKLKPPKKYNIWALNNDITSFDEVVWILVNALNINPSVAAELTIKVDREGKARVNEKPMSKGIAEAALTKVKVVQRTFAETHMAGSRKGAIMELKFIVKES